MTVAKLINGFALRTLPNCHHFWLWDYIFCSLALQLTSVDILCIDDILSWIVTSGPSDRFQRWIVISAALSTSLSIIGVGLLARLILFYSFAQFTISLNLTHKQR